MLRLRHDSKVRRYFDVESRQEYEDYIDYTLQQEAKRETETEKERDREREKRRAVLPVQDSEREST